jgi:cold shock CspA family protein
MRAFASGPDVFVYVSAVERAGMRSLNEGQKLSFGYQSRPPQRQVRRNQSASGLIVPYVSHRRPAFGATTANGCESLSNHR